MCLLEGIVTTHHRSLNVFFCAESIVGIHLHLWINIEILVAAYNQY